MKALSIRQPWAWLIVNGHKDIENRSWPTKFRGRVLIHASQGMTRAEYDDVDDWLHFGGPSTLPNIDMPPRAQLERGGIVGVATITDCVPPARKSSPWHMEGAFGFQIADARSLPFVECKGALLFFEIPHDVAAQLRQMHELGAIA